MGNCTSSGSAQMETARLILPDGQLLEFSYPVKVSYLVQKNPECFICNSDEMDFDDVVLPVREDEELQPGQLYFALPLSKLKRRLQAQEMAALAVKANSALMRSGKRMSSKGCSGEPVFMEFSGVDEVKKSFRPKVAPVNDGKVLATRPRRGSSGGKGGGGGGNAGKFMAKLSAIPE